MSASTSVKTVDRLVRIIDSFSSSEPAWTLTDLSERLGLPKSTLHRFLGSLEAHGILRQDAESKYWRLGYRLCLWGALAEQSTPWQQMVKPIMHDLVADTGETALLTVYASGEVICLAKVETNHPVRLALDEGARRPPHAGASSKVLMAYLPEERVDAIIRERGLPRLCVNTITDVKRLKSELAKIRRQGFASSFEETDRGAWGVATPIRDQQGAVVAAVGVAGPDSRFSEELADAFVTRCKEAAERISSSLFARVLPTIEVATTGAQTEPGYQASRAK